jgi:hypothetical protein
LTDSGNRQEKIMAFINELISDEDKKKIDWTKFKAWPFTPSITPWKWTIDRERDVFLYHSEGVGQMENVRTSTDCGGKGYYFGLKRD